MVNNFDYEKEGIKLGSAEEATMLEINHPEICSNWMKRYRNIYDIVETIPEGDILIILQKIKHGVCDDVGPISSISSCDTVDLIRYKNREYGELIRKYNLTVTGVYYNLMSPIDPD